MQAKPHNDMVAITAHYFMDNIGVLEIKVNDTDYLAQPQVLEYEGRLYGKSSWNSDTMLVCYRTDKQMARVKS